MGSSVENYFNSHIVEHTFSLTNYFNECCPYFMSIGMTYEQFWYGDPTIAEATFKSFKIKEKREAKKIKWTNWEIGLYVYEAICDVAPVLQAFSKAKKPLQFSEKPYNIEALDELDENKENVISKEKEKKKEQATIYREQIFFQNWARATKKKFKEKNGGE